MLTATLLVPLLLAAASDGPTTEVILKDRTKLVGVVRRRDEVALYLDIKLGGDGESIGGSVVRPVRWTEIESIDGLSIKEWLEEEAKVEADAGEEAPPEPRGALLERFRAWMARPEGFAVGQSIAAIAILVLIPALLLHRTGKLIGMEDLEGVRSLGGALLALGAAWAALEVYPAWGGGVPWASVGAAGVMIWLVMRPAPGQWVVLVAIELVSLLALVAGILAAATRWLS